MVSLLLCDIIAYVCPAETEGLLAVIFTFRLIDILK